MTERWKNAPRVAVVGGGLAGLAGACALAESGLRVTLFERRPYLGGRASSYEHPGTGEIIDNCQHVLLGCCTNLIDFYRRTGVEEKIRWYDRLTFLEPGGRASVIKPSFLPAPLHTAPAFLRAHCLNLADKISIAAGMVALAPMTPGDSGESFLAWLRRYQQTDRAIHRFWKTVLVSALNEDMDRVSVPYAAQVVRESFLKSAAAGRMGVPTVPLTELYNAAGSRRPIRSAKLWNDSRLPRSRASISGSTGRLPNSTMLCFWIAPSSGCSTNRSSWLNRETVTTAILSRATPGAPLAQARGRAIAPREGTTREGTTSVVPPKAPAAPGL
jgi:protoporphyrinogen oxidase